MAYEEHRSKSPAAKAAWPLLVLTAALQVFSGLSFVAYKFMGVPVVGSGFGGWIAAMMGGLQAAAAVIAFVRAARSDLRGAIFAVAGSIMLGWLSTLPVTLEHGLSFAGDDKVTPSIFVISPIIALAGTVLAWRNYLIAAALTVSAMTFVGILIVLAFGVLIALYGF